MANLEYFSDEDVISFTLLDAHTVERLQRDGDIKLPRKKVDIPKDERWNTKQMSSKLLQGILAGDAIPTIANSLMQVIGNNAAAAVRNARTMVTGAENVGRLDSYEDLAEKGVVQKKVWIATADDRTRESHLLLDGEEVDIDKPFSNGLMYPADPSGDPAEVYNCRCSMRDHIVGFRRADGSISLVGAERDITSHAGKIEDEIAQRGLERVAEVEKFDISSVNVTLEDANEDWFEYENANAMAEYIRTGVMPEEDINGIEIPKQRQLELAKEAQLIQDEASSTKTSYKTLYRGMIMNEDEVRAMFTPNEMYTFDTITATATDRNVAEIYSNVENSYLENPVSVIFEIQKPDGIYGYDRDGVEVIMPQGAQFRVVSNTMDEDGVVHIGLYAKKGDNVLDDFVPESTPAEAPAAPAESDRTVVNGSDISESWTRRPDEFDFAIEDVVDAQGFNGLPRVVPTDEFDRYVEESNFIAQRTYSAPDQETLDAYRDQLYNGKWYVDCSEGGAAHGRGMYCVREYSTEVTQRMNDAMISYGSRSQFAYVETFTFTKDAKIIKENEIRELLPEIGEGLSRKYLSEFGFSDEELKFLSNYAGVGGESSFITEYLSSNRENAVSLMREISSNSDLNSQMMKMADEYIKVTSDQGVMASMLGYDAIDCGEAQGYMVILNRTKIIFKGD